MVSQYQQNDQEFTSHLKPLNTKKVSMLEDTKGVIRRCQRGNQKIPKGESEDTKGVIRSYQRGNQKIPKG
jgi:hypothetical protein